MAYRRECRIVWGDRPHDLAETINAFLADGWAVTHMSTAASIDHSGDYPAPVHYVTVMLERPVREPEATDEESPAEERERRGW